MLKLIYITLISIIVFNIKATYSQVLQPSSHIASNTISAEAFGAGGLYTVEFDRWFKNLKDKNIKPGIGFGFSSIKNQRDAVTSGQTLLLANVSLIKGKGPIYGSVSLTGGGGYYLETQKYDMVYSFSMSVFFPGLHLIYHPDNIRLFISANSYFIFNNLFMNFYYSKQISWALILKNGIEDNTIAIWPGISLGYSFGHGYNKNKPVN